MSSTSIRLTQGHRAEILKSITEEWTKNNPEPDVKGFEHKLADKLFNEAYGKIPFNKVPKSFFRYSETMRVSFEGGGVKHWKMSEPRPDKIDYGIDIVINPKDYPEIKQLEDLIEAQKEWQKELNTFSREINAILAAANTTKQLTEMWPNVEKFIPGYLLNPEKAIKLPALPISRLEQALGIKPGKKK